ncbi:MAG: hypothetical protein KTR22_05250 [Flavobacteriaceae bacterium]|nr:hypothetical protein [Flavobacteriaceae bacterium]
MHDLSTNNNTLCIATPAILTIGAIVISLGIGVDVWIKIVLIAIIGVAGTLIGFQRYNKTENLYFDHDFLYLKSVSETRKVKLAQVKRVRSLSSKLRIMGTSYYKYSIEFYNGITIESVGFWVSRLDNTLEKFEEYLAHYAPNAEIR